MSRPIGRHLCWLSLVLGAGTALPHLASAATLAQEVAYCEQQLGFTTMPDATNCFAPETQTLTSERGGPSRVNYFSLSNQVDAVLHCESLNESTQSLTPTESHVLMTIHNRVTGYTCFFGRDDAHTTSRVTSPVIPSLNTANAAQNGAADSYWIADKHCTECHTASGPYLAAGSVSGLAHFGILNNGHDTLDLKYSLVNYSNQESFLAGDSTTPGVSRLTPTHDPNNGTCGGNCHNFNAQHGQDSQDPLPNMMDELAGNGTMPPAVETSEYRWINSDNPISDGLEIETFTNTRNSFPVAQYNCSVPTLLEAHAVGSSAIFSTAGLASLPDKLNTFNTREGLVCLSADQPGGRQCNDYSIRYLCSDNTWTSTYNMDSPTFKGDHEERSQDANVCTPTAQSPHRTAIAIQATTVVNGVTFNVIGPNDRLQQFTPTGRRPSFVRDVRFFAQPWPFHSDRRRS